MSPLLAALAFLAFTAQAQNQVATSTLSAQPARRGPVFGAPLKLRFRLDQRGGARGELGFAVRWDVSDLPDLPRHAAELALDPLGTTGRAAGEALSGADVGIYSLHFKAGEVLPLGLILGPLAYASAALRPPDRLRSAAPPEAGTPAPQDRRHRLNLTPVQDELQRGFKRELRRALITAGFDLAVPVHGPVPYGQKEAVIRDLQQAGSLWEEDYQNFRRPAP